MKIGVRKPSIKKSMSARTTGKVTRSVKKLTSPGYGKKGVGMIKNPSKSLYNKVYSKTTTSIYSISSSYKVSKSTKSNYEPKSSSSSYKYKSGSYKSREYKGTNHNFKIGASIGENDTYSNYELYYEKIFLENKTKYYPIEYTHVKKEGYNPTCLKDDRFDKEITSKDEEEYINKLDSLNYIEELPTLKKKDMEPYSIYQAEFNIEAPKGYILYDGLDSFSHCIHYNNRYDSIYNLSCLYFKLQFNNEVKSKLQMNKVRDRIFINTIYEYKGKIKKGEICYIKSPEIYEEIELCNDVKIEIIGLCHNELKFNIYIEIEDFDKILSLRKENERKKLIREEKYKQLIKYQDVSYQFSILGLEAENEGYLDDAILNYEKAIELGYSISFTYERLYLIYKNINNMNNAIRILKKAIEDLTIINRSETLIFLDGKIDAFKTVLDSINNIEIPKEELEVKHKENIVFEEKSFFSKLLSRFKNNVNSKDDDAKLDKNVDNEITKTKSRYEDVEEGIIEYNKLLMPLKTSSNDFQRREFYVFEPEFYVYYDKLEDFSRDIHFYTSSSDRYCYSNQSGYDISFLDSLKLLLRFGRDISIDCILEKKDEKMCIVALYKKDGSVVKCEIGYIKSPRIISELEVCTDIKVQIRNSGYGCKGINLYVREEDFDKILLMR